MQTLVGPWKLASDPENTGRELGWFKDIVAEAQDALVPGIIQQVFPGYHGVAWYWNVFEVERNTAPVPGERFLLRFGAVDYLADVWVNGNYVGSYEGGETPFEFDITGALRPEGANLLAVRVLNPTNEPIDGIVLQQTPHRCKVVPMRNGATFDSGGIMYPVELRIVPPVYLVDVFAKPEVHTGRIGMTVALRNSQSIPASTRIACSVTPSTSGELLDGADQEVVLPTGYSEHDLAVTIMQPHLWDLDDPYLYRVAVQRDGRGAAGPPAGGALRLSRLPRGGWVLPSEREAHFPQEHTYPERYAHRAAGGCGPRPRAPRLHQRQGLRFQYGAFHRGRGLSIAARLLR